jgi:hypothetical protein
MKQCPECKTTYTDDSLSFCLSDGKRLIEVADEEQTVVRSAATDPIGFDLSTRSEVSVPPGAQASKSGSASRWVKVAIGLVVLGVAAVAALGLAGAVFYYNTGGGTPTPTPAKPTPTPAATSTPDTEKERLQNEIANIRKLLEDQKRNANTWDNDDDDERGSPITATVDSPNDGFLALRNQPDAERGERLAKIPHGAEIEIVRCTNSSVTIAGRSGRWCYVSYNGHTGWVFDAWLEY